MEYYSNVFLNVPTQLVYMEMIHKIKGYVDNAGTRKGVLITGGKGTGKSFCFFAIQQDYKKPVLLVNADLMCEHVYLDYFCKGMFGYWFA